MKGENFGERFRLSYLDQDGKEELTDFGKKVWRWFVVVGVVGIGAIIYCCITLK